MSLSHKAVFYKLDIGTFIIKNVIDISNYFYESGGYHICQHAVIGKSYVDAIEYMIYNNSSRIMWASDSDSIYKYDDIDSILVKNFKRTYKKRPVDLTIKYLRNDSKKIYIDLDKVPTNSDGVRIHPLPYLTICELDDDYVKEELDKVDEYNNMFDSKHQIFLNLINENHLFVQDNIDRLGHFEEQDTSIFGTWLGDLISTSNSIPDDYTEIPFNIIDYDTQN